MTANIDGDQMAYAVEPIPFVTTFRFDWPKPPLSLNQRLHHMAKAKIVSQLRSEMHARARHIPDLGRCEVRLTWFVNTKARRDDENPVPTLKALCDGLVDAEVVEDDTNEFMVKHMPEIRYVHKSIAPAHFEFEVRQIG